MKITDNIHLLKIDFAVQVAPGKALPRFVNSLIIFGKSITVVDSGVEGSHVYIYDYIKQNKREISEIETLIISHAHPDHIGSAKKIKEDTGCRIIAHHQEKDFIENIDLQYSRRPVPGFYNLVKEPAVVDEILYGGETLSLDTDITARIINTPGHSKGSFCILFNEDKVLFTADAIPVENDIPTYDSFKDLQSSMTRIGEIGEYSILLTSWTSPLFEKSSITQLFELGKSYLDRIDSAVKEQYPHDETSSLENCKKVLSALGLPPLFAVPLVDNAFKTHF